MVIFPNTSLSNFSSEVECFSNFKTPSDLTKSSNFPFFVSYFFPLLFSFFDTRSRSWHPTQWDNRICLLVRFRIFSLTSACKMHPNLTGIPNQYQLGTEPTLACTRIRFNYTAWCIRYLINRSSYLLRTTRSQTQRSTDSMRRTPTDATDPFPQGWPQLSSIVR